MCSKLIHDRFYFQVTTSENETVIPYSYNFTRPHRQPTSLYNHFTGYSIHIHLQNMLLDKRGPAIFYSRYQITKSTALWNESKIHTYSRWKTTLKNRCRFERQNQNEYTKSEYKLEPKQTSKFSHKMRILKTDISATYVLASTCTSLYDSFPSW